MPFPRALLAITLTAALGITDGCGSSGASTLASAPAARQAAATPVAVRAQSTSPVTHGISSHAQYETFARAVNLKPSDMPGFTAKPTAKHHSGALSKDLENESQYQRCIGISKEAKPLFKGSSDQFNSGKGLHLASASSDVQIVPTPATVRRELAQARRDLRDPTSLRCVAHLFEKALGTQDKTIHQDGGTVRIKFGGVRVAPVALGSMTNGTEGSVGLSVSMSVAYIVSAKGRHATIHTSLGLDILAFAIGRAEVTFSTMGFSEQFPAELESRLFSLLVSRAVTASHEFPAIEK